MQDYKELVKSLIEDHIKDTQEFDPTLTRKKILEDLQEDTQDLFGNLSGSRTYSTYDAQQFIDKSGAIWDTDIHDLFDEMGDEYFFDTLKRGAETLDVVICELVASQAINEMLEA